jgi:oligopeptide/dipeptide ABC transporter ATP-binding protein
MNEQHVSPAVPPVLQAHYISVEYRIGRNWRNVIKNVDLVIEAKSIHGLVGESGSGKSTLGLAILQALPRNGRIARGELRFEGRDMRQIDESALRELRGQQITFVPQNPMDSLNPSIRISDQMIEAALLHDLMDSEAAGAHALRWLERVHIADPKAVADSYPHQLSGGMLQRVLIAMALMHRPSLVILDEPTTALDVTTQATILDLLRELIRGQGAAALYISHDLGAVAELCDDVSVMYAGELMESGAVDELFARPRHPYTRGLLACLPGKAGNRRLRNIEEVAPALQQRSLACVFADRCPHASQRCRDRKPVLESAFGTIPDGVHLVRCWHWKEIDAEDDDDVVPETEDERNVPEPPADETLFSARGLEKSFGDPARISLTGKKMHQAVRAVDNVSIGIPRGKTLGIVGESGSGKTTLARTIVALERADAGEMELEGLALSSRLNRRYQQVLRGIRMIFQNPGDALNPHHSAGQSIGRTFRKLGDPPPPRGPRGREELRRRVTEMLEAVGLSAEYYHRYPDQLSGGEKQRVAIARAFAGEPKLIIADEPTSSLDVSVQAVILNLLKDLREKQQVSYAVISHDLEVIEYLADHISVMYLGEVVESGSNQEIGSPPYHPYTQALLAAAPRVEPGRRSKPIRLEGDIPSPRNKPSGCPFHTRCPMYIGRICREERPPLRRSAEGHEIRCHHTRDDLLMWQGGDQ